MKAKKPIVNTKHLALALVMFIGSIGSIAWLNPEIKNGRIVSKHASQAIHKLTAIVQKAIAGEKPAPKTQQPANTSALIKTGTLKDTLSNSSYIPPATKDTFDFTAMKKLYTSTEWERLNKELILTRDSLHTFERNMPESAQLDKAQKALDSATKSKSNNYYYQKLGLQIVKDAKTKYENSSEIKQKQAEYKRLSIKIFNILVNDPDEKNYQKDMERRRDSLTNAIGPNSPGSNQLKWSLLERAENIQSELIQQKIFNRPDVKPINDSLNAARHALYEGPAWEEYNKAMNDPDRKEKVLMEMNDPDLVKYKAAVSTLRKKIRDNPEYKKYSERIAEYTRKYNELINKLHWE